MRKKIQVTIIFTVLLVIVIGCQKKDTGPENCVVGVLENSRILADIDPFAGISEKTDAAKIDPVKIDKANKTLESLFQDNNSKKRILAALRLYEYKSWEVLKTVTETAGTFVVVYLRTDSTLMGEPVKKRPGWRKSLFKVVNKEGQWVVADLDYLIKNYGDKPFYNIDKE